MRSTILILSLLVAAFSVGAFAADSHGYDYNSRFVRNYPPGFYGMWYKAEKFVDPGLAQAIPDEGYRWDKFMSKVTDLLYPFHPIPFRWDYGSSRTFNLPDYNSNDWP